MFKKIILLTLLLVFITTTYSKQLLDKVIAVVDNGVITSSELNKQVEITKRQITAQNLPLPLPLAIRKQALQELINLHLQLQMAKQYSISIDNNEVNQAIERIAAMNHITLVEMQEEIKKQGMNWDEYHENIRKEILLSNLQQKVVGREVTITNDQVEHYLNTEGTIPDDRTQLTFHLKNIIVPVSENPSVDELQKARTEATRIIKQLKHASEFTHLLINRPKSTFVLEDNDLGERHLAEYPELYAKELVSMQEGQIVGPLKAGNGFHILKLVSIGGKSSHLVNLTHVRHILLKPDANMLAEDAKKQVYNIYQQLKSGKNFETMAKQYSLDTASAVKGGDLGWVTPGELVPEFEKTMNHLPLNQISTPVKTQFGWHLIEVLGRKQQDDSKAFRKQQIRQYLHQKKFLEAVQNWQQHIRADAYIHVIDKDLA